MSARDLIAALIGAAIWFAVERYRRRHPIRLDVTLRRKADEDDR